MPKALHVCELHLLYFIALFAIASASISAQVPLINSFKKFQTNSFSPVSVCVEADSNLDVLYIGGSFEGTLIIGNDTITSAGQSDGFICAFNMALTPLWLRGFGGAGMDAVVCMDVIEGKGLVAGMYCGANTLFPLPYTIGDVVYSGRGNADVVLARIATDGGVAWSRNEGDINYELPYDVEIEPDGGIAVCGVFDKSSRFNTTHISSDANAAGFLYRVDMNGVFRSITHSTNKNENSIFSSSAFVAVGSYANGSKDIVVKTNGTCIWGSDTLRHGESDHVAYATMDENNIPVDFITTSVCAPDLTSWEPGESNLFGATATHPDLCGANSSANLIWFPYPMDQGFGGGKCTANGNAGELDVNDVDIVGSRTLAGGSFNGDFDFFAVVGSPDISTTVPQGNTDGLIVYLDPVAQHNFTLSIGAEIQAQVHATALTKRGFAIVASGTGRWNLPMSPVTISEGELAVIVFLDPVLSVDEESKPVIPQEPWMVYDLSGTLVSPLPITLDELSELSVGTYVLHSNGEVSLCHVLGAHNFAFAHSTASKR